ncbi:MAG: helix-turn-helix domain-containing protein [Solirubrobacteraceae bacterium]|nr:helix-turn-helix domain-containing protein [Patulibacter sp.]
MAEIGAALREARTRARIEIAQMEAQTKIRAKYLRALENEEWELLPGPTYVKSFLKTYGDMLGLDGRQLVAEYKSAREPFQAVDDIGQMSKHTGGRTNRNFAPPIGRWAGIAVVVLVIVAGAAYAVFGSGSDSPAPSASTPGVAVVPDAGTDSAASEKVNSVVVTATASVTVCARAGTRIVVPQTKLHAGERTKAVRGRVVVVTADNRSVRVAVNGTRRTLPASSGPITVVVSGNGIKKASPSATACRA